MVKRNGSNGGERELTGRSRLGMQQRDGVVAVMRKNQLEDVAAASRVSRRRSLPAGSRQDQPINEHPMAIHAGSTNFRCARHDQRPARIPSLSVG
jgi:hypothetical protein